MLQAFSFDTSQKKVGKNLLNQTRFQYANPANISFQLEFVKFIIVFHTKKLKKPMKTLNF